MVFDMLALGGILLGAYLAYRAGKQDEDSSKLLYMVAAIAAFLWSINAMGSGYSIRIGPVPLALLMGVIGALVTTGTSRAVFAVIAFVLFVGMVPLHF